MSIVLDIQRIIEEYDNQNCQKCKDFENAIDLFKHMINEGLAKPRENNLLPIENKFSFDYKINKSDLNNVVTKY
jgi:pentatricopeptide repeat protein